MGVFGTPEELTRMVKMLDSPWFTACVDVGHAALADSHVLAEKTGRQLIYMIEEAGKTNDRHFTAVRLPLFSGHRDKYVRAYARTSKGIQS